VNLALDEDRELLRKTVRDFAKMRVRPRARDWDEAGDIPAAVLDEGWQLGLAAAGIPAKYGGASDDPNAKPSALTGAVMLEELAWADLGYAQRLLTPLHVLVPVAIDGSEAQRTELLPALCGEKRPLATAAWIEPHRTFDLFSIRSRADARIDGPALFGKKTLVPSGADAELTLVYARARPSHGPEAVEAHLVRGAASGMTRGQRNEVMGPRAVAHCDLTFDECTAPPIGEHGADYSRLAQRALVAHAAAAVGVARAAWEYAADYAKERIAFGKPIAQNQSIAFMIAEAAMDSEAARWMTWKAAWRIDRGEDALREAGLAFRFATDACFKIADNGVQILGGHGVIRDHLAELFFRNARALGATAGWFMV
jgi:acyl-CoA dehydrogenase